MSFWESEPLFQTEPPLGLHDSSKVGFVKTCITYNYIYIWLIWFIWFLIYLLFLLVQGVYYYFYQIFRNKAEVAALERSKMGIGDGSVGMLSSLVVAALSGYFLWSYWLWSSWHLFFLDVLKTMKGLFPQVALWLHRKTLVIRKEKRKSFIEQIKVLAVNLGLGALYFICSFVLML